VQIAASLTMNIASHLRHYLTFLGALGTIFLSWNLLTPDQVAEANEAGSRLIEPLVILTGLVAVTVFRLAIAWLTKLLRVGTGDSGKSNERGPGMMPCLMLACVAGSLLVCPSCTPVPALAAVRAASGSFTYSAGSVSVEISAK